MHRIHVLFVWSLGVGPLVACGGTSADGGDAGGGDAAVTEGGGDASGGGTDGGEGPEAETTSTTATNDCPNCSGTQVCCLARNGAGFLGTCAATATACPSGAAAVECSAAADCAAGQMCCVTTASGGGPSGARCQSSCPAGAPPACGGNPDDNADCPADGGPWACEPLPGTPTKVLGQCVIHAPAEAGAPDGGVADGGAPVDASEGGAPADGAADG